jgi:hypothetical protein
MLFTSQEIFMTVLPQDDFDRPIPALRLKSGAAHSIAVTATSARNTVALDDTTRIVSIFSTVPVYIKFGGNSVTATTSDHYFPAGLYYDIAIGGDEVAHYSHVAVLRAETDGTLYISEKE